MFRRRIGLWISVLVVVATGAGAKPPEMMRDDLGQRTVDVAARAGDVQDVLQMLASQYEVSLSVAHDVTGQITLSLVGVPLLDALDVITAAVGAEWYLTRGIIVVKSRQTVHLQQLRTEIVRLQYLKADEARKMLATALPENAKIEVLSGGTGAPGGWDEIIQLTAAPDAIAQAQKTLKALDRPRPMVEIEARIIETVVNDDTKLGIDWPNSVTAQAGGLEGVGGSEAIATRSLEKGVWTWGTLSFSEVSAMLEMLETNGRSKLLSKPRVTTMSNQKAHIDVTTTIPIQTLNRFTEAAAVQDIVSFQDLEVGISLEVTPRVTDDSTIMLEVSSIVEEITGYTGPPDNQRPITSKREVNSSVTVKAGESLGIGGLMKDATHRTVKRIPLLGSIPLLGYLFQHHSNELEKTDLLILITPRIISMPTVTP